jgi:hypothetical protein
MGVNIPITVYCPKKFIYYLIAAKNIVARVTVTIRIRITVTKITMQL